MSAGEEEQTVVARVGEHLVNFVDLRFQDFRFVISESYPRFVISEWNGGLRRVPAARARTLHGRVSRHLVHFFVFRWNGTKRQGSTCSLCLRSSTLYNYVGVGLFSTLYRSTPKHTREKTC